MAFDPQTSTKLAKHLASLHIPGNPLLLTNIWDAPTTTLALSHPSTKALATASFAIASTAGLEDAALDLTTNLHALRSIRRAMITSSKHLTIPLTADIQDGYSPSLSGLKETIEAVVELGVVGVNLEDVVRSETGEERLVTAGEQAERIRTVIEVAKGKGVEGFVVNARTDCVLQGRTVEEAVERGQGYLEAGATCVFVWGGARGLRDGEVKQLVEGLDGKVSVIHKSATGFLTVKEIKDLGVARISMGPGLWREGMAAIEQAMKRTLESYE